MFPFQTFFTAIGHISPGIASWLRSDQDFKQKLLSRQNKKWNYPMEAPVSRVWLLSMQLNIDKYGSLATAKFLWLSVLTSTFLHVQLLPGFIWIITSESDLCHMQILA